MQHEVDTVRSGHRVTLTYNLYFGPKGDQIPLYHSPLVYAHEKPRSAFGSVLKDPDFFPDGGLLGFGLRRQYPIDQQKYDPLKKLYRHLKGSDALLLQICREFSLEANLMIFYPDTDGGSLGVLLEHPPTLDMSMDKTVEDALSDNPGLGFVESVAAPIDEPAKDDTEEDEDDHGYSDTVHWVTDAAADHSRLETGYVAYGNDACMSYVYGNVCLVVTIGPHGKRETQKTPPKDESDTEDEEMTDAEDDNGNDEEDESGADTE